MVTKVTGLCGNSKRFQHFVVTHLITAKIQQHGGAISSMVYIQSKVKGFLYSALYIDTIVHRHYLWEHVSLIKKQQNGGSISSAVCSTLYIYYIYTILELGISCVNQMINMIYLTPRLRRLSSSHRLIVSLSFKSKYAIPAQLYYMMR